MLSYDKNSIKTFFFESKQFLLKKQQVTQTEKNSSAVIEYPNFFEVNGIIFPSNFAIQAMQNSNETKIEIEYKSISKDEELSFPYSVPSDYEQVFIK